MTIDEMIAVLQSAKEGKPIEYFNAVEWVPIPDPLKEEWDFKYDYRVKPDSPQEWWMIIREASTADLYESYHDAAQLGHPGPRRIIHVREVLE